MMGDALWCVVCGSVHAGPADCPGDLRATGAERHGWRVAVETPHGIEAYGVLVAPTHERWRARILTFPNVLWTIPGGAATLKFVANTPQRAEALAVSFVEGHIKTRGYVRRDQMDPANPGRFGAEMSHGVAASAVLRKAHALPVRFGNGPTLFSAMTANLSESGMFVADGAPRRRQRAARDDEPRDGTGRHEGGGRLEPPQDRAGPPGRNGRATSRSPLAVPGVRARAVET